jgi:hypothetical protein
MTMNPRINKDRLARHIHDVGFVKPKRRVPGAEEKAALLEAKEHQARADAARAAAAQARAKEQFERRPEVWKKLYRNLPLRKRAELYRQALGQCVLVSDKREHAGQITRALQNFVVNMTTGRGLRGNVQVTQPRVLDPRTMMPRMKGSIV